MELLLLFGSLTAFALFRVVIKANDNQPTDMLSGPEWRNLLCPACPWCGKEACRAQHALCNKGTIRLHLPTGICQCSNCSHRSSIENWVTSCSCGCEFEGGNLWSKMHSELHLINNQAWAIRAGIVKGKRYRILREGKKNLRR